MLVVPRSAGSMGFLARAYRQGRTQTRFRKVLEFAEKYELDEEAAYWRKAIETQK